MWILKEVIRDLKDVIHTHRRCDAAWEKQRLQSLLRRLEEMRDSMLEDKEFQRWLAGQEKSDGR